MLKTSSKSYASFETVNHTRGFLIHYLRSIPGLGSRLTPPSPNQVLIDTKKNTIKVCSTDLSEKEYPISTKGDVSDSKSELHHYMAIKKDFDSIVVHPAITQMPYEMIAALSPIVIDENRRAAHQDNSWIFGAEDNKELGIPHKILPERKYPKIPPELISALKKASKVILSELQDRGAWLDSHIVLKLCMVYNKPCLRVMTQFGKVDFPYQYDGDSPATMLFDAVLDEAFTNGVYLHEVFCILSPTKPGYSREILQFDSEEQGEKNWVILFNYNKRVNE